MARQKSDPWVPLRTSSTGHGDAAPPLPGRRGRYLLYLGPPVIPPIDGKGRYVHLSWRDDAWRIRDFIAGNERREGDDMTIEQIWRRALDRIPAVNGPHGDLFVPHTDGKFWRAKLQELTAAFQANKQVV